MGNTVTAHDDRRDGLRIVALGTSLTARGAWVDALPGALEAEIPQSVSVVNCGKAGATSRWGHSQVGRVVAARPDLVLIEFAVNDAAVHRGISPSESARNVVQIIRRLRTADEEVRLYLMTMNPVIGVRQRLLRHRLGRYYELHRHIAELEGAGHIDHGAVWNTLPAATLLRSLPDGAHPIDEFAISITLRNIVARLTVDLRSSTTIRPIT